jgi:hypothetical protein
MKREEAQQHGQTSTLSSLYRRVPNVDVRDVTLREKMQLLEHKEGLITIFFSRTERAIQLLTRCVALILAVVNCVYTHDMAITLLLLAISSSTVYMREM